MPIVSCLPYSSATRSFVPTPSVPLTKIGSRRPSARRSNMPPKPPSEPIQPTRCVLFAIGLILSTSAFPASMSTPADAYVMSCFVRAPASARCAMSRRYTMPSNRMLDTPAYTRCSASSSVSPTADTARTRPPAVNSVPSAARVVPAWYTDTCSGSVGISIGTPVAYLPG